MAILMTHFWPGATEKQYREEIAGVHPNGGRDLPAGQIFHAAGPAPGGFLISVVWDSKASADRFVQEVLMPNVVRKGGFEGRPVETIAEIVNLQGL
jgi:hypothetical protein